MRWRWDTPRDADEFHQRARDALSDLGRVTRRGGLVTLVVAGDRRLARRLAGA